MPGATLFQQARADAERIYQDSSPAQLPPPNKPVHRETSVICRGPEERFPACGRGRGQQCWRLQSIHTRSLGKSTKRPNAESEHESQAQLEDGTGRMRASTAATVYIVSQTA